MRAALLLLILLLSGSPVSAQVNQPAARPDSVALAATATAGADTLAAIHRLFAARRQRSHLITGVVVGGGVVGFLGDTFSSEVHFFKPADGLLFYCLLAAPYELTNLLCHRRYTKKAEELALADSRTHQLSPKLKRRLKKKYFGGQ